MRVLLFAFLAFIVATAQGFLAPLKTTARGLPSITSSSSRSRTELKAVEDGFLSSMPGSSNIVVADYFSTVDEIARNIGDTPWLQYFIPTAVGMSISLAIVYSLYATAQPYEGPPQK